MTIDVNEILKPISSKDAMSILCLFLAQKDEPRSTHEELGFKTQQSAFEKIATIFGYNHHTVKLTRDSFDHHTDSSRTGWREELRPALKSVWDDFSKFSRTDLLELCLEILSREWVPIDKKDASSVTLFEKIEQAASKTKIKPVFSGIIINFSNTRGNWFAATIDQLISSLSDILANINAFRSAGTQYNETNWRSAFDANLEDEVSKALAGTQTLPYFSLLAKIIHFSNSSDAYADGRINLEEGQLKAAIKLLKEISTADKAAHKSDHHTAEADRLTGGNNTIYYGAPGTGKSHTVDKLSKNDEVIRTVFHPDVQNSDFVGTLKPVREGGDISYRFSPGPFSIALVEAMNNPDKKVWLVIEELNRAPAAAVFGDLFLLLDREENGTGEYDVNCPNEEFARWFEEQTGDKTGKIRLPSNLWIAATMNSADQGVYPLDTAFRRRWIQKYIRINYDAGPNGSIGVMQDEGYENVLEWRAFVKALNEHLTDELSIAEDRLVGPWFVKESELGDDGALPGKVLIYLWDDLLRHHGREAIFNTARVKTYGDLSSRVDDGKPVFSDSFLARLAPLAAPATEA